MSARTSSVLAACTCALWFTGCTASDLTSDPDPVAEVIVDQPSGGTGQHIGSQDYPDVPASSRFTFDDVVIIRSYGLTSLTAYGGETTGNPVDNVAVYATIYSSPDWMTTPIVSTSGTQIGVDLLFDFGGALLPPGTYWLSAYVVRANSKGQWRLRLPIRGSQAYWHNPGGGSGYGTPPLPAGDVLEQADVAFVLSGVPMIPE